MKQSDFNPGIIIQHQELDPAVLRAQRMQELSDLAEYRFRRLKQFQEWSDPVKRAERQRQAEAELEQARHIWAQQVKEDLKPPQPTFRVKELVKPRPQKWYQRLWERFVG